MYATSGHSPQASREYDKPMRIWEGGEGEGSVHREGEGGREGGEETQKQSCTDSELIMTNNTTVINTH